MSFHIPPETGQLEEKPSGLAARQKFFQCSCQQSWVGLDGRNLHNMIFGEYGEAIFLACHQMTETDQQKARHRSSMRAPVSAEENCWIARRLEQKTRDLSWASVASLPPEAPGEAQLWRSAGPGSRSSRCWSRCCCCSSLHHCCPTSCQDQPFRNLSRFAPE